MLTVAEPTYAPSAFCVPPTSAEVAGAVVSSPPPPSVTTSTPVIWPWPGIVQWYMYLPGVRVTSAVCLPPSASFGLARMFSWTSWLYAGSLVMNVSVCGMPVVLPVASLFSKTIVAGPATAVSGADAYLVMSSPAVQVSTWSAAAAAGAFAGCPEADVACSPSTISRPASSAAHILRWRITRSPSPAGWRPASGRRPRR